LSQPPADVPVEPIEKSLHVWRTIDTHHSEARWWYGMGVGSTLPYLLTIHQAGGLVAERRRYEVPQDLTTERAVVRMLSGEPVLFIAGAAVGWSARE
jgi:hypothetical protein